MKASELLQSLEKCGGLNGWPITETDAPIFLAALNLLAATEGEEGTPEVDDAELAECQKKCERLKFHADAMAVGDRLAAKDYVLNGDAWNARAEYLQAVKRYRADKEAK